MISIQQALDIVLSQDTLKATRELPVSEALGYALALEVYSPLHLPPFDNSAMDGYAVCGYEETYNIKGEVAAGETQSFELKEGEAMRIFTGGMVPKNTTAVIMQEKASVKGKLLNISDEVILGKNIRRKGEEIKEGSKVFDPGQPITPATVGVLCSLGMETVQVFEKPKTAIITTGNELIQPGTTLEEGQIYESNGAVLQAALQHYGFSCQIRIQIKDDFDAIKWGIGQQLDQNDVVLLSGGISVGDYDYVKQALEENGVQELFYKVEQKPGKPLYFGRRGDTFVFALPGNPASALTCFYMYALPLLQKISGFNRQGLTKLMLPLAHDYVMKSDRPTFFKATTEAGKVRLLEGQGSSMIHSLALGNALAFIDSSKVYAEGDPILCYLL